MMPAATKKGGNCAAWPDTCKTPAAPSPIPIPYPNIAQNLVGNEAIKESLFGGGQGAAMAGRGFHPMNGGEYRNHHGK